MPSFFIVDSLSAARALFLELVTIKEIESKSLLKHGVNFHWLRSSQLSKNVHVPTMVADILHWIIYE